MLITTAADSIFFSVFFFSEKNRLNVSCELQQMIHLKCQLLFSLNNNKKKKKKNRMAATILLSA